MGNFFKKHRQLIRYVFWGAATTFVNYIVYFFCTRMLRIGYLWANIAAWIIAVLFAFAVNKQFVFEAKDWRRSNMIKEFGKFVGARIFSGFAETGLLWLCVDLGNLHDGICKVLIGFLVVLLNYLFSKLFIFGKRR